MENFKHRKVWGQNFLVDNNILQKIVEESQLNTEDIILEIGPGAGALTKFLSTLGNKIIAVEIDKKLHANLIENFEDFKNIVFIREDFLKLDFNNLLFKPNKLVANIPYNITSPIIFKIIYENLKLDLIILMMQKEVGERIVSCENLKTYGVLSIVCQTFFDVKKCFNVSRNVFHPKPKIDSIVIKFIPKKNLNLDISEIKSFIGLVKFAFSSRRKIFFNLLCKQGINKEVLENIWVSLDLDFLCRPENISVIKWFDLYKLLKKYFEENKYENKMPILQ